MTDWLEKVSSATGVRYLIHTTGRFALGRDARGVGVKQLIGTTWQDLVCLRGAEGFIGEGVAEDLFTELIAAGIATPDPPTDEIIGLARSSVEKARQGAGGAGSRSDATFQQAIILGRQWRNHLSPAYRAWIADQALIDALLAATTRLAPRELDFLKSLGDRRGWRLTSKQRTGLGQIHRRACGDGQR
jgi:hypothetical protein